MPPLEIIYAYLPDEQSPDQSAAWEFANRVRRKLKSIDPDVILTPLPLRQGKARENEDSILVFVVSCGADGSVHRCVRKFSKQIKEEQSLGSTKYGIALLGHAVCKASAEQLKEQIFGAGRRLAKALQQACGDPVLERLEIQVEIVAPEEAFDPWLERLFDKIQQLDR